MISLSLVFNRAMDIWLGLVCRTFIFNFHIYIYIYIYIKAFVSSFQVLGYLCINNLVKRLWHKFNYKDQCNKKNLF